MIVRTVVLTRTALARFLGLPHGAAVVAIEDRLDEGLLVVNVAADALPPQWRPPQGVWLETEETAADETAADEAVWASLPTTNEAPDVDWDEFE